MKKIDLVYILGNGSRWRNNEIRYSLRSVEKNLNIGKIFIVGEYPSWITGAIHIPAADIDKNKQINARAKYLVAAKDKRISEDFILMNDDFFILKPIQAIPYYSRGTIEHMMNQHPTKGGYYYNSLKDTKEVLNEMGVVFPIDFEIHAPIIFNKDKLISTIEMIGTKKAYSFRSCYGNLQNVEAKKTIDFKAANLAEFTYQTNRSPAYLSITDSLVAAPEFRNWIRRTFPNPSKYETDRGLGSDILPGGPMCSLKYYVKKTFIYFGKTHCIGEIIPCEVMDEIRNNPNMKDVWEFK